MKKILTFLSLMLCFFATAQERTDTMYIYKNDNTIKRIPVSKIDSIAFVTLKKVVAPDTPVSSYEAVDLGLSVKWATCNVGASSPEEYGGYYAWGEIEEKDSYTEDNSFTYGKYYGDISGNPEYDVACAKWGGAWRMPTAAEQQELLENCTWRWTAQNGINGYKVIAPNGNSIFLPASGCRNGTKIDGEGELGYYWSGSVNEGNNYGAYYLDFNSGSNGLYSFFRNYGFSVRPVCDGTTVPVENYTVSVLSNGNGVVSIEGTQESSATVSAGASVTVVATPADGYKFIGWYIGESETPVSTDAVYTFTVSANVALVAKFEAEESGDSGSLNGHDYVDLGLSVKWATCNVGASSPEEYGGYYAWGEIEEKDDYSWNTYRWCNGSYDSMTKYCTDDSHGTVDNKSLLDPEDDVAHVKWGGNWRMPTQAEQDELRNNCTWTFTTLNGVNGCEVTGPNGNSIFLPAAGDRRGTEVYDRGSFGRYWSSSLYIYDSDYALELEFNDSDYYPVGDLRYVGGSVRPVCDSTINPAESYTVSVSSNGNGVVSIEGTQENSVTVSAGASVTVVATPADGYKFIGWYIGESETPVSTDAVYTFTVSANVALVAKFELIETSSTTYEAVDLGLPSGLKWATCNVGASSPEEYGGYYAWGEIEEKDSYTEDNSVTYGKDMSSISGNPEYDVASAQWGDTWRMPTSDEINELCKNCTWEWTTRNNVNGYKVTGPNGNSIFLPAAGNCNGTKVNNIGSYGCYWSGSMYKDFLNAYDLLFNSSWCDLNTSYRYQGLSVRPVYDGATVPVESYSVSVSSNGNGVVSIEGTQESSVTVSTGASVTVVATPDSGYKFIGWYIGESDTPVSTDAVYTFTVSANVALVAKFESFVKFVDGHGSVDLGLPSGLKWATCNVGASSPEESGAYRIWSATAYDWGNNWRMPTQAELEELINNCTWSWIMQNGVNGVEFTGNNGNRIFLPAAGFKDGSLQCFNEQGCYWSSTYYNSLNSYPLLFNHNGCTTKDYFSRDTAINIRLVLSDN